MTDRQTDGGRVWPAAVYFALHRSEGPERGDKRAGDSARHGVFKTV